MIFQYTASEKQVHINSINEHDKSAESTQSKQLIILNIQSSIKIFIFSPLSLYYRTNYDFILHIKIKESKSLAFEIIHVIKVNLHIVGISTTTV